MTKTTLLFENIIQNRHSDLEGFLCVIQHVLEQHAHTLITSQNINSPGWFSFLYGTLVLEIKIAEMM